MSHLSAAQAPAAADEKPGDVFKALADPSRRLLLDSLFLDDGQTLSQLASRLPGMTRFGVMKHLRQLEAANIVVSRKVGREKRHFLNPLPIRLIHDRWIGKYAEPWAGALAALKASLERADMDRPRHLYQVFIRTTPEQLWRAITDPSLTERYFFATRVESEWRTGALLRYWRTDGQIAVEGEVIEADPPRRLVMSWAFRHSPEMAADPPSRVTWEIEALGEICRLTLVHDNFPAETETFKSAGSGWPLVLSSLKSLLETGQPLPSLPR
ncbi:MAG: SRPBCC domain-containing protein [Chloroflexota bacterium]|nr:SRPBCC domain-containing protein [Chloroflexota bacterium]